MTYQSPTAVQILTDTRGLLSDPVKWIKGCPATNRYDVPVHPRSPDAVCWCLGGALSKSGHDESSKEASRATAFVMRSIGVCIGQTFDYVGGFNDCRGTRHADVLLVLNMAIELAYNEESI